MSWSIGLLTNTVKISGECAKDLFDAQGGDGDEIWYNLESVTYKGKVTFNPDHSEWMDWLGNSEELIEVLKKHKVKGDICFGSMEGDNAGEFWGYRFDGKGGMAKLKGKVSWDEEPGPPEDWVIGKTFAFTGSLGLMSRKSAQKAVLAAGGLVATTISYKVDYLVVGDNPGSKLLKAKKLKIKTLNEKQFSIMVLEDPESFGP